MLIEQPAAAAVGPADHLAQLATVRELVAAGELDAALALVGIEVPRAGEADPAATRLRPVPAPQAARARAVFAHLTETLATMPDPTPEQAARLHAAQGHAVDLAWWRRQLRSDAARVVPPAAGFDAWALPSDPAAFDPGAPIPAPPYLAADRGLVAHWQRLILPVAHGRLRIGLAWAADAGRPTGADGSPGTVRTIRLAELAPLAAVPGVAWFSLQKTAPERPDWPRPADGGAEAEAAPERMRLVRLGPSFTDLADTAGALASLDLVITVDTSIAHLAGALGRPTWVLLPAWPDWRWGTAGETTPFYPSMRLFRQDVLGEWGPMVERVAGELAHLARGHAA